NELGQTTFQEMANNVGTVVPLAAALKINIDELFGSFATLTGVTGNTSEVATQLRSVMQGLANPTDELTKLIEEQTGQSVEQAVASEGL
ncbi:phage tail tape measure protein, partial [candidate division KSB1 bacterium]|nr:phage tail tape measure protein [candidate division KSB1 bacterium]NIT71564.1 phage tail tape measure protein [candidate division KSB1 bacterium]NIW68881.1 phage tail tape measure protein [candidate division KSB1 bacterium]NIX71244.1 phage tail tape measure protein [candidate division KSB1 bacterium]